MLVNNNKKYQDIRSIKTAINPAKTEINGSTFTFSENLSKYLVGPLSLEHFQIKVRPHLL